MAIVISGRVARLLDDGWRSVRMEKRKSPQR
jgi:hypothetical protein